MAENGPADVIPRDAGDGGGGEREGEDDETVLKFLDSLDAYLALSNTLSSTLRQGWLELAGARHSMGTSRISSTLFDLKVKPAATITSVDDFTDKSQSVLQPRFTLSKWVPSSEENFSEQVEGEVLQKKSNSATIRHRGPSHFPDGAVHKRHEACSAINESSNTINDIIQKERSKSLSVFGTLVSPKLRAAQVSFETALETIVEVANMRSSLLAAYSQLQQ